MWCKSYRETGYIVHRSTGGPDLQGSLQPAELTKAPQDSPFLLGQGEPGTSQYCRVPKYMSEEPPWLWAATRHGPVTL